MATKSYHRTCPICKGDIQRMTDTVVIGHDNSQWPAEPPRNIIAHRQCVQTSGLNRCLLIQPGQTIGQRLKPFHALAATITLILTITLTGCNGSGSGGDKTPTAETIPTVINSIGPIPTPDQTIWAPCESIFSTAQDCWKQK